MMTTNNDNISTEDRDELDERERARAVQPALTLHKALKNMISMWDFLEPGLRSSIDQYFLPKVEITLKAARAALQTTSTTARFVGWQAVPGKERVPLYSWPCEGGGGMTTGDANGAVRAGYGVGVPNKPKP